MRKEVEGEALIDPWVNFAASQNGAPISPRVLRVVRDAVSRDVTKETSGNWKCRTVVPNSWRPKERRKKKDPGWRHVQRRSVVSGVSIGWRAAFHFRGPAPPCCHGNTSCPRGCYRDGRGERRLKRRLMFTSR